MSPLARLVPYVRRYRRRFLVGLACLVLTTAFSLLGPWVLRHAVDDLTAGVTRDKLTVHAAALLGLAMAGGGFRFLTRRILVGASRAIEYDLRNAFVAHLQRLPLAYFHATRTGDLMSRATNDLNAVRMMVGPAVMYMASTGMVFVVAVALMLSIDPVLTLAALACLPVVSVAVKFFGSAVYRRTERIQAQLSTLSAVVQEGLAGVRVVRAYCREGVEAERFGRENREYYARNAQLIRIQALFYPSLGFILGLAGVLVLWLGARHVIEGRITVGQFVAFNAYLLMLSWPMIAFGFVTNLFQRGMAAWGRMCDVFDAPPAEPAAAGAALAPGPGPATPGDAARRPGTGGMGRGPRRDSSARIARASAADPTRETRRGPGRDPADGIGFGGFAGGIEFRDLTFAYDGRPVLEGVSARVEPGRVLGVIGPTGSGKSTLLALLPRLFNPPRGTVFIDGVDVRDLPLPVLRRQIAMVPQDPFLFSDTIAGNVAFGVEAAGGMADPGAAGGMADAGAAGGRAAGGMAGAGAGGLADAGAQRPAWRAPGPAVWRTPGRKDLPGSRPPTPPMPAPPRSATPGRSSPRRSPSRGWTPISPGSRTARRPGSGSAASPCRAGRSSARRWRGPSPPTRASSLSTTRCRRWTRARKRTSWPISAASCADARRSWCRTASRRCARPISSSCSTGAASSSAAPTTSWWRATVCTPGCTGSS